MSNSHKQILTCSMLIFVYYFWVLIFLIFKNKNAILIFKRCYDYVFIKWTTENSNYFVWERKVDPMIWEGKTNLCVIQSSIEKMSTTYYSTTRVHLRVSNYWVGYDDGLLGVRFVFIHVDLHRMFIQVDLGFFPQYTNLILLLRR